MILAINQFLFNQFLQTLMLFSWAVNNVCENIIADRGLHRTFCGTTFVSWILFKCNLQPEKTLLINRRTKELENLHIAQDLGQSKLFPFFINFKSKFERFVLLKKNFFFQKKIGICGVNRNTLKSHATYI